MTKRKRVPIQRCPHCAAVAVCATCGAAHARHAACACGSWAVAPAGCADCTNGMVARGLPRGCCCWGLVADFDADACENCREHAEAEGKRHNFRVHHCSKFTPEQHDYHARLAQMPPSQRSTASAAGRAIAAGLDTSVGPRMRREGD